MVIRTRDIFTTVTTEGALLPPDLLQHIAEGSGDLEGLTPESYHLYGERLNEATNYAWNRLQGAWQAFQHARTQLAGDDAGASATRERWLLPLFNLLGYGRLDAAPAVEIDGKSYPVSHRWRSVPIHLLGCKVDLDRRTPGIPGAATGSPHSILQVFLNRSDDHLWGFLSNGLRLRVLRDNISLIRPAYIEFDLEAMMAGEVYADFVLLYLLCHQSRVEAENPAEYWLERWMKAARDQGTRALDQLRAASIKRGRILKGYSKNRLSFAYFRERIHRANVRSSWLRAGRSQTLSRGRSPMVAMTSAANTITAATPIASPQVSAVLKSTRT
ncbi:MAG: hypothetical protein JXB47_05695 [Anaerolineae bacterium]|nr:hypothetical protein [Anaerolineae bacterium]